MDETLEPPSESRMPVFMGVCPGCGAVCYGDLCECLQCHTPLPRPESPHAVITCHVCGFELEKQHRFCVNCGAELGKPAAVSGWTCPECAASMPAEKKFCTQCGSARPQK
jgi:hypothetical protein